jgi:tetratricopeptide (TPR) repeat protein
MGEQAVNALRKALAVRRELANRPGTDEATILDYGNSLWQTAESLALGSARYDEAMALLEEGLSFAAKALRSRAHRDVQAMMDTTIGRVQMFSGNKSSEALAHFHRSLAYVEAELAHPQPAARIAESRYVEAVLWVNIGMIHFGSGHPEEGLACHLRFLELMKALTKEEPLKFRHGLIVAYGEAVGRAYVLAGWPNADRGEAAMAAFLEAQRLLKQWGKAEPNTRYVQFELALVETCMGWLRYATGHRDEARSRFENLVLRTRAVARADPSDLDAHKSLVQCLDFYGALQEELDCPEKALAAHEEARSVIERWLGVNSMAPSWQELRGWNASLIGNLYRRRDALSLASRALALAGSGHPAQAVEGYRRAIKTLEGLDPNLDMPPPGFRNVPKVIKVPDGPGRIPVPNLALDQYHLACDHARLAQLAGAAGSGLSAAEGPAERYRAPGCLRAAVAAGFRDLARIRADADLDVLRSRGDFQLLMMDLAMPDDPFAR